MKRVLYLTEYVDIGGGESSLLNMIYHFKKLGKIKPILLVPRRGEITKQCEKLGIQYEVISFGIFKKAWIKFIPIINLIFVIKLSRLLIKEKIDLIHVNSSSQALVNCLLPSFFIGKKVVWTCHGWWEKPYGIRAKLLNIFLDKVFVVSDYVRQYVEFPQEKVTTTYLGIDLGRFSLRRQDNKNQILKCENINQVIIGMIGRFQPVKGQHLFLQAAEEILTDSDYGNCLFVMIGDTAFNEESKIYKEKIMKMLSESKNKEKIKLIGFDYEIEKYYEALDVLVVPSEFESFSMVTLEGLAKGLKVIATDHGGPKEIIEEGKSGFIFKTGCIESLVLKIKEALNSSNEISTEAARRAELFSIEKIGEKVLKEYEEIWG